MRTERSEETFGGDFPRYRFPHAVESAAAVKDGPASGHRVAVAEQEAKRALANATAAANVAQSQPTAPGQPESFVFPVTVALDETAMRIDNATIPLTPGMTVTVEIKTDSRRVIDYLLSPLAKMASEAARER